SASQLPAHQLKYFTQTHILIAHAVVQSHSLSLTAFLSLLIDQRRRTRWHHPIYAGLITDPCNMQHNTNKLLGLCLEWIPKIQQYKETDSEICPISSLTLLTCLFY
ncbi:hypothetical protein GOODEAATRI_010171, partial [Goodea atripinnis]